MEVIYILLSMSVLIAIGFLVAFIWSVKKGQYEDVVSPSIRILYENKIATEDKVEIENIETSLKSQKSNNYGTQQQQSGKI